MTSSPVTIKVQSAGGFMGDSARITLNDQEIGFVHYSRGLNVAVIDEATGQPLVCTTFDTFFPGNADRFADLIEQLPSGQIVAIAVKDEASANLSQGAKRACQSLGSRQVHCLRFRTSWALIGQKDAKPGIAQEELSDYSDVICSRLLSVSADTVQRPSLGVISAGVNQGNFAQITWNKEEIGIEGGYQRGLNVVVFDRRDKTQAFSRSFDLFANPENADAFAQLIEECSPEHGIAIAVKDDASVNLSERAKQACESIGSRLIRHLQLRSSWAIVGYKDRSENLGIEQLSHDQVVSLRLWI
ncbi:interleukin-like EMT inducer domain-containing protein [Coleofasciculus chthonoplastes]|uniref:interleukin-like EMT inducer domain-containing protein n=1 Tax=Coleofasciculus chthonoplastes TaxID=64178 RepID=UPI0032F101BA